MINNIQLRQLRGSEYIQFITDTLHIVGSNNTEALIVKLQYEVLQSQLDRVEKVFKLKRSSNVTKDIEELDARRGKAINGVMLQIHALTYSTNSLLSNHAKMLEVHLQRFGSGIAKQNYQSETTILRNIVHDWKTQPELMEAIEALQLTAWQREIEAANNAFSEAYNTRNDELAAAPTENLKTLRLEANEAYYKLRNRLNAFWEINDGAEPWARTIHQLNQHISDYQLLLNRRGASSSDQEGLT